MRYGWIWLVFLAITFTGAALLFTEDTGDDALGITLILAPMVVLGGLMGLYYWKSRAT